ncbi:uncharacterized protein EMH_0079260 [Eimeria mitis]|uniref:Transmembrane protein n=1 Tax=Eimeria mitis TaxID=44415 RepID=U6KEB9_9EIME|nr:uncharacterized protein EMH_0079260 [Eimeria mitis]CDJ36335.1 hypothetical protein EMH_0079260 [Eimeria mitis]
MRGSKYFFPSFSAFTGCLCTVGTLATGAEAPVSATSLSPGIETESNSQASFGDDAWPAAVPTWKDGWTGYVFSGSGQLDVSLLQHGPFRLAPGGTRLALPKGYILETEAVQADLSRPYISPKNGRGRRRRLFASVSTAFLIFAVCLGLMTVRYKKLPPDPQPAGFPQTRPKQRQQDGEGVTAEQLLQSVDELKKLQPLAANLAEMVGTDESRSALQELCSSVKRSQDIAQTIAESSGGSSGSPLTAVKTAIEDSVSAFSRLYEAARERGLSLAQEVQKERPPVFSEEEMQLLDDGLGKGFREFMNFREQNTKYSFSVIRERVEKAAVELKRLRSLEATDDLHLLVAVATNLEVLKISHVAIQVESESSDDIRASATAVLHMQYLREHASRHRELEGQLEELRLLCILERQRRQILPQQDISVLKALDWLEVQLNRGEQQLQKHKEMLKRIEEADDILFASSLEQQAGTIADCLKTLLKAVANRRRSIPGVASEEEAAQSAVMQRYLKLMTLKTSQEAAADVARAGKIIQEMGMQQVGDSSSPFEQEEDGQKQPKLSPSRGVNVTKLIADAFRQVEDANAAMRKPVNAEEETQEGHSSSDVPMEEMLRASRKAANAAGNSLREAELMWLHVQLTNSLELDMQLSATLVEKAIAAVGMATGEEPKQQHWHVEMRPDDIKEFKDLLAQFKNVEEDAQSANALNERASAAAMMKQVALKLTMFVEERQNQPRRR